MTNPIDRRGFLGAAGLVAASGVAGPSMPRHLHRASDAALLVLGGDVELELDGKKWRMLRAAR